MKKIWLFIGIVFIFIGCTNCKLEKDITHNTALPIVKSLARYAKVNGIPKSFKEVKDFPYKLEPCSKKPNILECKVLKDGYFFIKNGQYYSIKLWFYPFENSPKGFGLIIIHNTTNCGYDIFRNKRVRNNYLQPACSMIGKCRGWGRQ